MCVIQHAKLRDGVPGSILLRTTSSPEGPPLVPSRRHQDPTAAPRARTVLSTASRVAVPVLLVAVVVATAAAAFPASRTQLLVVAFLLAVPAGAAAIARDRALRAALGRRPARASAESLDRSALQHSGPADAAAWTAAITQATGDPRAQPTSIVRLRVDAPNVTGPGRAEEIARLQAIAAVRWREILRPGDALAQLGPSEFAVLLPRCDGAAAAEVAGRLQQAVPEAARSYVGIATSGKHGDVAEAAARATRTLAAIVGRRDPLGAPERLAAVGDAALAASTQREALDRLARGVADLLGTPAVLVTLVDEQRQHLIGASGADALDGDVATLSTQGSLAHRAVITTRPVLVSDTDRYGVTGAAAVERNLGVVACATVPFAAPDGQVLGAIEALQRVRHEWSDDDAAVLRLAAARIEALLTASPGRVAASA